MRSLLRDAEHLVRLVLLFAAGTLLFLVARAFLIPPGFGEYGHFRSGAIDDNADRAAVYAGRQACAECHDEQVRLKASGAHAGVGCESCHGALASHAADPGEAVPERPQTRELCIQCHAQLVSRPAGFPQVDVAPHSEGEACNDCHQPHAPTP